MPISVRPARYISIYDSEGKDSSFIYFETLYSYVFLITKPQPNDIEHVDGCREAKETSVGTTVLGMYTSIPESNCSASQNKWSTIQTCNNYREQG